MPLPSLSGAPKLPKSHDAQKVYNVGFMSGSTPVPMGGGGVDYAAGSVASSADIALWKRRREEMIARGEDPDAAVKAREAKRQDRKDKMKRMFGMKGESSKEAAKAEASGDDSEGEHSLAKEKEEPNPVYVRSTAGTFARFIGK